MSKKYTYAAIKVQQMPESLPFYLISCSAKEVLQWADVPRSKEAFMAGYQRELGDRHEKIADFFLQDPVNNIIPNAVIVAIKEGGFTENLSDEGHCSLTIEVDEFEFKNAIARIVKEFEGRLSASEIESISLPEDAEVVDEDVDDPSVPPESYMANLVKELREAATSIDDSESGSSPEIVEFLLGMSKPGLILDGQHRIFGAKEVADFDINFPLVLIPSLEHKEQVFHFYVLNNMAKSVDRTHLRRIVSTALSKGEIEDLYSRFKQAKVETGSADWTHRMNNDESSPFRGLILQFKDGHGVIPENVAFQLVSRFMDLEKRHKLLVSGVDQWSDTNFKIMAFYSLWKGIKEVYPKAWEQAAQSGAVAGVEGQIFYKISLLNIQEYLLDSLNKEMPKNLQRATPSPLAEHVVLEEEVGPALYFLKEEFFIKAWKKKGLDTRSGNEFFRAQLDKAIQNQSKNIGNMSLFKD